MMYFGSRYVLVATILAALFGSAAHAAQLGLQSPEGLVFQGPNILWIADYKAKKVFKVNVSNLGSPSVLCSVSTGLQGPTRLAISGTSILVVDTIGKTVQAYNSTNCTKVGDPLTGFNRPLGVAVSGSTAIVIDNGTDEVWTFSGTQKGNQSLSPAAPGAIAVTPTGDLVIGFGPTNGPSQIMEYALGNTSPPQLNLTATLVSDSKNTGPTGLVFLPSPAGTTARLLLSDLYSGNFAYYECNLGANASCGTPTAVSTGTGGTEGIAVNPANNEVFVANSTKGNITVYSGPPAFTPVPGSTLQ